MSLPEGWEAGRVTTNGIELQYYRSGEGPPIVLAHGMYDNGRRWRRLAADLGDTFELIAYDARGHGRSDAPPSGYDMPNRVADLMGLLDALALEEPILLGHSMGAATVAWAGAWHPTRPAGIVLVDPSRFRSVPELSFEEARAATRDHLETLQAKSIEERLASEFEGHPDDEVHRRLAAAVDECSEHVVNYAHEHDLVESAFDEIGRPTLVLRRDLPIDERVADLLAARRLADGRLVHVPDAGHYVFLDAYGAAVAELRAFLACLNHHG